VAEDTPIDLDKLRSIGYLSHGRSKDQIRESRRPDGVRIKATTDQLGNTTTEHATKDDRVDVHIRAPHVAMRTGVQEMR
jgi:hypothetical protein